jgi:hypothetical protein
MNRVDLSAESADYPRNGQLALMGMTQALLRQSNPSEAMDALPSQ